MKVGDKVLFQGKEWEIVAEDEKSRPLQKMWDYIIRRDLKGGYETRKVFKKDLDPSPVI